MTENANTPVLPTPIAEALAKLETNQAFAAMVPVLSSKFAEHYELVLANNRSVARIKESKNTDPENTEYQDLTWARVVAENGDPKLVAAEKKYQRAVAESEKLLAELRIGSKTHMEPALSEDEVAKLKTTVQAGKSTIAESAAGAKGVADMADQMLGLAKVPVENGIWSLMPTPDSLMNTRGRKAGAASEKGPYATSLANVTVDGASANKQIKGRDGTVTDKASFTLLAEYLNKLFGAAQFEGNSVTAEELEKAYYQAAGLEFRDKAGMETNFEFTFTKDIEVQNPNDDSSTVLPKSVVINVERLTRGKDTEETADENNSENKNEEVNAETNTENTEAAK